MPIPHIDQSKLPLKYTLGVQACCKGYPGALDALYDLAQDEKLLSGGPFNTAYVIHTLSFKAKPSVITTLLLELSTLGYVRLEQHGKATAYYLTGHPWE